MIACVMRGRRQQAKYPYFSDGRTSRYLSDNGITIPHTALTFTSPSLSGLPTISRTTTDVGDSGRAKIAKIIEKDLGSRAVTRFNVPRPIGYARGSHRLIFGEFRTLPEVPPRKPALLWTAADYDADDRHSVAICLFGSMNNFTEYIQGAPQASTNHWSSSSAPSVLGFLRSRGKVFDNYANTEDRMAMEALHIAVTQRSLGLVSGYADPADWLAELYLDVDLTRSPETGNKRWGSYRRILVGAPLWIRATHPGAIRLYADQEPPPDWALPEGWATRRPGTAFTANQRAGNDQGRQLPARQVALPIETFNDLVTGFIHGRADSALREEINQQADGRCTLRHLGDPLGRVFAWIWRYDSDRAMLFLADYLAAIRLQHDQRRMPGSPPRLTDILNALRPALPYDLQDSYPAVIAKAREEVLRYYGKDPDADP
jgi:hypothetical protein